MFTGEHAERLKECSGNPYRPSNGTEGDMFMCKFCINCAKYDEGQCDILADTFFFDVDEEGYPEQWIIDNDGQPTCTAFDNPK